MRKSYTNAKKGLGECGVALENVVGEVLYVTNMEKACAAVGPVRKAASTWSGEHKPNQTGEIRRALREGQRRPYTGANELS